MSKRKSTNQEVTLEGTASKTKRNHGLVSLFLLMYVYNLKRHHKPWKKLLEANTELDSTLNRCLGINKCPIQSKMPAVIRLSRGIRISILILKKRFHLTQYPHTSNSGERSCPFHKSQYRNQLTYGNGLVRTHLLRDPYLLGGKTVA